MSTRKLDIIDAEMTDFIAQHNITPIGHLYAELLTVISRAPPNDINKSLYVNEFLDMYFDGINLDESFNSKLVLVYEELITAEILTYMHQWFLKQCCNINNICVIFVYTLGIKQWYTQYLELMAQPGLTIIEATWINTKNVARQKNIPQLTEQLIRKQLKYYFSFYGGSYSSLERDFLSIVSASTSMGWTDYCGIKSSDTELDNYLEQLTYFSDRNAVDKLLLAKQLVKFKNVKDRYSAITAYQSGVQWKIDKGSAIQVVRETLNDSYFTAFTEKTIRSFIHLQVPMMFSGVGAVDNIKGLGFQFCDTIVDYNSYQYEKQFFIRVSKMFAELTRIKNSYTLKQLEEIIIDNKDVFYHNYDLIQSGKLEKLANSKIKEELI